MAECTLFPECAFILEAHILQYYEHSSPTSVCIQSYDLHACLYLQVHTNDNFYAYCFILMWRHTRPDCMCTWIRILIHDTYVRMLDTIVVRVCVKVWCTLCKKTNSVHPFWKCILRSVCASIVFRGLQVIFLASSALAPRNRVTLLLDCGSPNCKDSNPNSQPPSEYISSDGYVWNLKVFIRACWRARSIRCVWEFA